MKKYKIVALIGKAGSGKDTLLQYLLKDNDGFNEIISCTTRPPREGEENGVAYKFLTDQEFAAAVLRGDMVEAAIFRDWVYGTLYDSLDKNKINIGVFNPSGIETMIINKDIDLKVFYITCSDKIRLIRQLNRESDPDIDEIFRRYKADEEDFLELDFDLIEDDNIKQEIKRFFPFSIEYSCDLIHLKNETQDDLEICKRTILENLV